MRKQTILFVIATMLSCFSVAANTKVVPLSSALRQKLIKINAVANGGYCNKGLTMELNNTGSDAISVRIEPGLMFKPEDSSCQPLILLGNEVIVLNPNEKKNVLLQTFCGNATANCPYSGVAYTFYKQVDTSLVGVLGYAKEHNLDPYLIQYAVWTYTNRHPISSIYCSSTPKESVDFMKYVAARRHLKVPQYYMEYATDTTGHRQVIKKGGERVYAIMNWNSNQVYRNAHVSVYKPNGDLYKQVNDGIVSDKYGSSVIVTFYPNRDNPGKYIVRVHDDANKVVQEKEVVLGIDPSMY